MTGASLLKRRRKEHRELYRSWERGARRRLRGPMEPILRGGIWLFKTSVWSGNTLYLCLAGWPMYWRLFRIRARRWGWTHDPETGHLVSGIIEVELGYPPRPPPPAPIPRAPQKPEFPPDRIVREDGRVRRGNV